MDVVSEKLSLRQFFTIAGLPGFVLLLRTIVMALISRQRSFEDVATVDTSATIQIALTVIAFMVAFYSFQKDPGIRKLIFHTPLLWFLLYTLWAAVTSLWSINAAMSAYRAFETLAWFMLICAVITRLYDRLDIFEIIRWTLYFALFTILFNTLNRARQFGFSLFSFDTLRMEQMWSTPFFFLALLLPVGLFPKAVLLPVSIFSLSNTAYAGMAGGLFALFTGKGATRKIFILAMIILLAAISLVGTEEILKNTIFYGKKGVGIEYTSGRDKITFQIITAAREKPLTGYGFVAGETFIVTKVRHGAIGAHNGFLSAQLGTGIVGTVLFAIFMISMVFKAGSKYLPQEYRTAFLASAILITIHTVGNPGLGSRVYGTWIPAMTLFTLICMVQQHYRYLYSDEDNLGDT